MVDLGPSANAALVVALVAAVLAIAIAVGAHLRLSGWQARYRTQWADGDKDVAAVLSHESTQIAHLRNDIDGVREQLTRTAADVEQSLRHVAVVRYDAFGDMGDLLSFSAALVDDRGDGLVISSIHARGGSRTYAKSVIKGDGEATLTPEEQQALAAARTGKGES